MDFRLHNRVLYTYLRAGIHYVGTGFKQVESVPANA